MDIANLLHSLTIQGLSLSLGEAPETIAVVGPVSSLTIEQQRALAEHKQTLLSMLTTPPTCYLPEDTQGNESEGLGSLKRCIEYFEKHIDKVGTHCPEKIDQFVIEPKPQESPCLRCGSQQSYLAIIHGGESLRRDCARCGRFLDFPSWGNREETAKILADVVEQSRYTEKANSPGDCNTLSYSIDPLF